MNKAMTINELIASIYGDNYLHIDTVQSNGIDCDCNIHQTMDMIWEYAQ